MAGFCIVLALTALVVAFMGGVIGYLIGKYWEKKQLIKEKSNSRLNVLMEKDGLKEALL